MQIMAPISTILVGVAVFLPIAVRVLFCVWYPDQASIELSEDEKDRQSHRTLIIPLAGFSFTALLGLSIAKAQGVGDLSLPIYFLFVSFICYLIALNVQGYKEKRWHDLLGTGLMDAGSLGLILAVVVTLNASSGILFSLLGAFGIIAWAVDWGIRSWMMRSFLKAQRESR